MAGPINYMGMLPQIDLGSQFLSGLQSVGALAELSKIGQQQEQAKRAQEQQALYEAEVAAALKNPSAERFAALTARFPQQREAFKQSWDTLSEAQKRDDFGAASRAFAALNSGRADLAESIFTQRLEAKKASGADVSEDQMVLDIIKTDPKQAQGFLGYTMFNADPDKYADNIGKLGVEQRAAEQAPAALEEARGKAAKATAEARTAEVTAKYADSQAIADLSKKQWDVTKIVEDINIGREQNRIRAMEVAASKEGNALKREELQLRIDEAKRVRDEKIREVAATAEAGASNIDNMLNTIQRIKQNPALDDVVGSFEGRMPEAASMLDDRESDAIALINTLGSQAFLAKIPEMKGAGALSNAEGDKLQAALQNLGRAQSEKQFRASLDEASRLLTLGRENLSRKTGIPLQGSGTPAAPSARPPLSSFGGVGGNIIPPDVTIPGR